MRKPKARVWAFFGSILILAGCASTSVDRIAPVIELPKDLPQEIQDKFKVVEAPVAEAQPSPSPSPEPAVTEKGKKSRKKTIAPGHASKGAFIYPFRRLEKDPVHIGERLVYEMTYFGVAAGYLTLTVKGQAMINQRKVYQIQGTAKTAKFFEMFYRVDDKLETFFDVDGLFSHRFHLILDESKQTRDALELYDSEKGQAYYWNRWNHYKKGYTESKEFFQMERFPQDSVSSLYYLRSLPLTIGKKYKFPVVTEGKTWEAEAEVLGTEMMDSPMGPIRCLILRPETRFQGVLKKTGESRFWVTDDDRKILVRVEAKVKIGAVVAQLKEASFGPAQ